MQRGDDFLQKYIPLLKKVTLFENIKDADMLSMLKCLGARIHSYKKGEILLMAGDTVSSVGIVLSGQAHVVREDIDGNQMIVTELQECDLFGETFACIEAKHCPVTVEAITDCNIMWIDYHRVITSCSSACSFHTRLIGNMLRLIAFKNLRLNRRLEILAKRSIRERLLAYLELQAEGAGSSSFSIPFDRNKLADYLCTDRSAMSRELGKMRDEGILEFEKNKFTLL